MRQISPGMTVPWYSMNLISIPIPPANTIKHQKGMREKQQSASTMLSRGVVLQVPNYMHAIKCGTLDLLHRPSRLFILVVSKATNR
jgi:hypothetical protein